MQYFYYSEGQVKVTRNPVTGTKCRSGQLNHKFVEQQLIDDIWTDIGGNDAIAGDGCRFREGARDGDYVVDVELEVAGFLLAENDGWENIGGAVGNMTMPEAQAFIDAVGITDNTEIGALHRLVQDLKAINDVQVGFVDFVTPANSICKAIYPFVGGTAATQKYNLINPVDSDAAFRIVFAADHAENHTANGYKPNGVDQYGDTKLIPNTSLLLDNTHLAIYPTENIAEGNYIGGTRSGIDIGCRSSTNEMFICTRDVNDRFGAFQYGSTGSLALYNCDSIGFHLATRQTDLLFKWFQNGVYRQVTGDQIKTLPINSVFIGGWNFTTKAYTSKNYGFASIGLGISDAAATLYDSAVYRFMRNLNRVAARPATTLKAGVCVVFDDIGSVTYTKSIGSFKNIYDFKLTTALEGTSFTAQNITDTNVLLSLGWEVCSHCDIVAYRETHTAEETYNAIIKPNCDAIFATFGVNPISLAYHANIQANDDVELLAYLQTKGFVNMRENHDAINPYYDGTTQIFNSFGFQNEFTFADYVTLIDAAEANNKILTLYSHYIGDTVDATHISNALMQRVSAYVKARNMSFYKLSELVPSVFN